MLDDLDDLGIIKDSEGNRVLKSDSLRLKFDAKTNELSVVLSYQGSDQYTFLNTCRLKDGEEFVLSGVELQTRVDFL